MPKRRFFLKMVHFKVTLFLLHTKSAKLVKDFLIHSFHVPISRTLATPGRNLSQNSRHIFSCFCSRNTAINSLFFSWIRSLSQYTMPPKAKAKGTKRSQDDSGDEDRKPSKKSKKTVEHDSPESSDTETDDLDLTKDKHSNFKISSWNVNGVRAWLKNKPNSYVTREKPDIFCVQEIKCEEKVFPKEAKFTGYHMYLNSADKKGYAGVGIFSKKEPLEVTFGIGIKEHDDEGRVITAEYKDFYLVNAYVPNSGRGLPRLEYRQKWDKDFTAYLKKLDKKKPVILCGDLNVAHKEIDLANPGSNKRTAGFTIEERNGFSKLLEEGFTDSFREFYPNKKAAYSFWTYMRNARANNVGWRLDYFVVSKRLVPKVSDSVIRSRVKGSDHCPIALLLSL